MAPLRLQQGRGAAQGGSCRARPMRICPAGRQIPLRPPGGQGLFHRQNAGLCRHFPNIQIYSIHYRLFFPRCGQYFTDPRPGKPPRPGHLPNIRRRTTPATAEAMIEQPNGICLVAEQSRRNIAIRITGRMTGTLPSFILMAVSPCGLWGLPFKEVLKSLQSAV